MDSVESCPIHGEYPCMIVEDFPVSCALVGASRWLSEEYPDPGEAQYLIGLLKDELIRAWQKNEVLHECLKKHLVSQLALVDQSAKAVAQA